MQLVVNYLICIIFIVSAIAAIAISYAGFGNEAAGVFFIGAMMSFWIAVITCE